MVLPETLTCHIDNVQVQTAPDAPIASERSGSARERADSNVNAEGQHIDYRQVEFEYLLNIHHI